MIKIMSKEQTPITAEEWLNKEEVEMEETKLSITEKFGAVAAMFRDVNY